MAEQGEAEMSNRHAFAGYGTLTAMAKFTLWAAAQHKCPMPEDVMAKFNASRATAHRWLNAYEEAAGIIRQRRASNFRMAA